MEVSNYHDSRAVLTIANLLGEVFLVKVAKR